MKTIATLLLTLTLTIGMLRAQTAKFDCYKGEYEVWKRGLKVLNHMEKNKAVATMMPFISPKAGIDSVKMKAIEADFLKLYAQLQDVNLGNNVVSSDDNNKNTPDFYERTYYSINKGKVVYYFQVLITADATGVTAITFLDKKTLVKRDAMILEEEKKKDAAAPAK